MALEGSNQAQQPDIELLRGILEGQQSRTVTVEEASEIGEDLLSFFTVLGESPDHQSEEATSDELAEETII